MFFAGGLGLRGRAGECRSGNGDHEAKRQALRMAKLMRGGERAQAEAQRMVMEKITAAAIAGGIMVSGKSPTRVVIIGRGFERTAVV